MYQQNKARLYCTLRTKTRKRDLKFLNQPKQHKTPYFHLLCERLERNEVNCYLNFPFQMKQKGTVPRIRVRQPLTPSFKNTPENNFNFAEHRLWLLRLVRTTYYTVHAKKSGMKIDKW